ncbi:MAG: HAD hydrolase-like protein [Ignavibacteriales bacterium]|nr:HAD hydrolase-like protein [Ignavibacteriales bacterium]
MIAGFAIPHRPPVPGRGPDRDRGAWSAMRGDRAPLDQTPRRLRTIATPSSRTRSPGKSRITNYTYPSALDARPPPVRRRLRLRSGTRERDPSWAAASSHPDILPDPVPQVFVTSMTESAVQDHSPSRAASFALQLGARDLHPRKGSHAPSFAPRDRRGRPPAHRRASRIHRQRRHEREEDCRRGAIFDNIIFDFDGTITNSREDIAVAQIRPSPRIGYAGVEKQRLFPHIGKPLHETFALVLPGEFSRDRIPQAVEPWPRITIPPVRSSTTTLFPGVEETLRTLHGAGKRLAVALDEAWSGARPRHAPLRHPRPLCANSRGVMLLPFKPATRPS